MLFYWSPVFVPKKNVTLTSSVKTDLGPADLLMIAGHYTVTGSVGNRWLVLSKQMLVSKLPVSVKPLGKSCVEPALALGFLCGDLKPTDLLMPFFLMCDLRN